MNENRWNLVSKILRATMFRNVERSERNEIRGRSLDVLEGKFIFSSSNTQNVIKVITSPCIYTLYVYTLQARRCWNFYLFLFNYDRGKCAASASSTARYFSFIREKPPPLTFNTFSRAAIQTRATRPVSIKQWSSYESCHPSVKRSGVN